MIITLFFVLLLIVGIVCFKLEANWWNSPDWILPVGVLTLVVGIFGSIVCSILITVVQTNKDVEYQNKLYERQVLEYRIEHQEDNIVGNELLYKEVVDFNNDLRSVKKWVNNPFTNWFNVKEISGIEYIEIVEVEK